MALTARRIKRYQAKKRTLIRVAKDVPCVDCGEKYPPQVMQFDHVRGEKRANVGANRLGIVALIEEIAKCDVVCANCHALRTWPDE